MGRDTSFYYSFLVLPAAQRRAIVAVWDFCRAVDDAVDEAPQDLREAQVRTWREELARCFDGATPETGEGRALQPLIGPFNLPRTAFESLIEGVEMDLNTSRYATFADLYEYCIRVASSVGLMCVEIFGCREAESRQYAVDLGVPDRDIIDMCMRLKREDSTKHIPIVGLSSVCKVDEFGRAMRAGCASVLL